MFLPLRPLVAATLLVAIAPLGVAVQDGDTAEGDLDSLPERVTLDGTRARIPFTLGDTRPIPVVQAMVNGKGPFSFYYDTGASVCVLHSGFVEELGIQVTGQTEIGDHTASARIPADVVKLDSLELGGMKFEGLPAVAFDRSRLKGDTIRGVLGLPLFREHLLTVDYPNSRLEITTEKLPEKGTGILPYFGEPLPEFDMTVGGKSITGHFDSGSPGGFMLPKDFVEGLPHKGEPQVLGRARTVNSEFEIYSVELDAVANVAGNEFENPKVGYSEILPNAIVGYQVLKDYVLSIDQRTRRLRMVPGEPDREGPRVERRTADGRRAGRRSLGIGLAISGSSLSIAQVMSGSAAERAGLRTGDLLLTLDGKEATREQLGKSLEGTGPVAVEVERGGEKVTLTLFADGDGAAAPRVRSAPLSAEQRREIVGEITRNLEEGYIYADKGAEYANMLRSKLDAGAYEALDDRFEFAQRLSEHLFAASNDRHLRIMSQRSGGGRRMVRRLRGDDESEGDEAAAEASWPGMPNFRETNHGFSELRLLEGNVGYLDLRVFSPTREASARVDAAMAFFDDVDALIIDIGRNRGGAANLVTYLSAYFFAEPTHLTDTFQRGWDEPRKRWTNAEVEGRVRPDLPVFVLTSSGTGSAAESFVFGLQVVDRVTVVGETTAGAGHFGDYMRPLPNDFEMFLPIGRTYDPETGKGFEGDGVSPDVAVPYADALDDAHERAREAARAYRDAKSSRSR